MNLIKTTLAVALLASSFSLTACKSEGGGGGGGGGGADSIGVPECDEYVTKYKKCLDGKVPAAQKATFQASFDTMVKTWKDAAKNADAKAGLATGCKAALDSAKQAMGAMGCEF